MTNDYIVQGNFIPEGWEALRFWKKEYTDVEIFLRNQERQGIEIYPAKPLRMRALETLKPGDVKVVILGQDPYHTPGMANGLAFSVQPHIKNLPPSLLNIFKEYSNDLHYPMPRSGDLSWWASECGVLLLNTVLTVEAGKPNSHAGKGWEKLTEDVIKHLSSLGNRIVFMLWGKQANSFRGLIDETNNFVVSSAHPSPLAANQANPFLGSRPFSKALGYNPDIDFRLR